MTTENVDNVFNLSLQPSGIAHLVIDDKSESMNTLKASFIAQISAIIKQIKTNDEIKALLILSGKDDSFIAGADIHMLDNCQTAQDAELLSIEGQAIFAKLSSLPIPVMAAIHGPCLGGGLELALACHYRICSDSQKTVLGLPEVQLGLLPGGGGTQRLPKLVGLQKALDMMLTGKQLRSKQALKFGLVDDVVPKSVLIQVAEKLLLKRLNGKVIKKLRKPSILTRFLDNTSLGRAIVFHQAEKSVLAKTHGNYPAPLNIIKAVKAGFQCSQAKAFAVEAKLFAELVMSKQSAQLRQIFFATTAMKKEQGIDGVSAKAVNKVAVLGGGLMGGGIAFVNATKANLPVRIKDIRPEGILSAYQYGHNLLNKKVKRRFISKKQMQRQLANIKGTTDNSGLRSCDFVIEAVFEDLSLKQQMVQDIEGIDKQDTIFASNTSSLPIAQIAKNAKRPENIIGLHYFSPVEKMPLVEIIPHENTSDETISTTVALAKKQGKTPIVVKDSAGFYVNRILAPYMNEAALLLLAGAPIEKVDQAAVQFGFPVGPFQLLDEVGIDIGAKIGPILAAELGERFSPPDVFKQLIDDGRLGKKVNKGLYLYGKGSRNKKHKLVDEKIYQLLNIQPNASFDSADIERCVYMMLNEAARCLADGVIRSARDGDIGAIFGIGFPPFLGGPFRYMDAIGVDKIVIKLTKFNNDYGERFTPCELLTEMAKNNQKFY